MGKISKWRKQRVVDEAARLEARKPSETMELAQVDPNTALKWLGKNRGNRQISAAVVNRYASDMRNGRWKPTFQGIAFDSDGYLLDGQHRLHAVVRADCTVTMAVFRGCDRSSFDCLDIGKSRSVADVLSVDDDDSARTIAAIARSLVSLGYRERNTTNAFIVKFARDHRDELTRFVRFASRASAACAAALAYAATDPRQQAAVTLMLSEPPCREAEDLFRAVRLLNSSTGSASQRARYELAASAVKRLAGVPNV